MIVKDVDWELGKAQVRLSYFLLVALFVIVLIFELGYAAKLPAEQEKLFERFLHFLEDVSLMVVVFWFQRQRGGTSGGFSDGPTITQTHTSPDGSKTVTTAPAGGTLPPPPTPGAVSKTETIVTTPPLSPEPPK